MGRLIATIKYGSTKTRLFLLAVFVLVAGGLALAIYGGMSYELWALAVGALSIIVGLMMVFLANFVSEDVDEDDDDEDETRSARSRGRRRSMTEEGDEDDDSPVRPHKSLKDDEGLELLSEIERQKLIRRRKEEVGGDSKIVSIEYDEEYTSGGDDRLPDESGDLEDGYEEEATRGGFFGLFRRRRRRKRAKSGTEGYKARYEDNVTVASEGENAGTAAGKKTKEKADTRESRALRDLNDRMAQYTPVVYRQLLHRYKVKKDFVPIVIDESKKFDTARTPALVWMKKKIVYFLLMEGNERVESMPLARFLNVTYRSEVREDNLDAYNRIRSDMGIYEQFEDVMPTFNSFTNRMGITNYTKNQYVLGGDVAVTPRSLRALRSKYKFEMHIYDSLKLQGEHSIYFKRAFEARLLWIDQVIGQQEYQNIISAILQQMVDDTELSRYDCLDNMEQMIQNRLITDEYADYYMQQRQRRDRGRR